MAAGADENLRDAGQKIEKTLTPRTHIEETIMTTILVDQYLCTRCGICSVVCPASIVDPADENTLPRVQDTNAGMCGISPKILYRRRRFSEFLISSGMLPQVATGNRCSGTLSMERRRSERS